MTTYSCVACRSSDWFDMFAVNDVPVFCNLLWPDQEQARLAQRGDIRLVCCRKCGLIYNRAFDESLLRYGEGYENSLHFSPSFQRYAQTLAERLIREYHLVNQDIIEIGCGGGEFLSMLCQGGKNRGVGFDPSHRRSSASTQTATDITVVCDFYSPKYKNYQADLICCRHVLEHIPSPYEFLCNVREAIGDRNDAIVFFEVPNSLYSLRDMGIWDIIYEHCSYFNDSALARLFHQTGFEILKVEETFGGQFLCIETRPASTSNDRSNGKIPDPKQVADLATTFGENFQKKVENWERNLAYLDRAGKSVVIWGAGSKGVTFLNTVKAEKEIKYVVDVNPHKHNMFVPGTGQQVIAPDTLSEIQPDVIIVMNPIYTEEIRHMMKERKLTAELVCV